MKIGQSQPEDEMHKWGSYCENIRATLPLIKRKGNYFDNIIS